MTTMKRIAAGTALAAWLLAAPAALAGSGDAAAIQAIQTLRYVDSVNVIDVAARSNRWVHSKRAMHSNTPLTPLQLAIAGNPALMAALTPKPWFFDLKSVYAARVDGGRVTIYLGDPPNQ